eukprot:757413-Hanusia_phi.AAC.3
MRCSLGYRCMQTISTESAVLRTQLFGYSVALSGEAGREREEEAGGGGGRGLGRELERRGGLMTVWEQNSGVVNICHAISLGGWWGNKGYPSWQWWVPEE